MDEDQLIKPLNEVLLHSIIHHYVLSQLSVYRLRNSTRKAVVDFILTLGSYTVDQAQMIYQQLQNELTYQGIDAQPLPTASDAAIWLDS